MGIIIVNPESMIKWSLSRFKEYVGAHDLEFEISEIVPEENIQIADENVSIAWVTFSNKKATLHYLPIIMEQEDNVREAMLFHEFTHILDWFYSFDSFSNEDGLKLIFSKSEVNAASVEMARIIGVPKLNNIGFEKIEKRKIIINGKSYTPEEYVLCQLETAKDILVNDKNAYLNDSEKTYNRRYKTFHNSIMYYIGRKHSYEAAFHEKLECNESLYFKQFEPIIQELRRELLIKNYNKAIKLDDRLLELFHQHYPNVNIKN